MPDHPPSSSVAVLRSGATVLAGSMAVNVLNYAFTLVMGRLLPVAAFGELAALFALQLVTGVPGATMSTLVARFTGQFLGRSQEDFIARLTERGQRFSRKLSIASLAVLLVLTPVLSVMLHIGLLPLALFALLSASAPALSLYQGILQGRHRFGRFAVMNVLPTLVKLALGAVLVAMGWGVPGILAALIVGSLLGWGYGMIAARPPLEAASAPPSAAVSFPSGEIASAARVIGVVTLLSALFTNADILLAKAFLPAELAGQYSALTVTGKVVLYGSGAFSAVVVPLVSAAIDHARRRDHLLLSSLAVATVLATGVAGVFSLRPLLIMRLLLGGAYDAAAPYLAGYAWAMVLSVMGGVLTNYLIARARRSALWPVAGGLLVEIIYLCFAHSTLADYVAANLACNAAFFLLSCLFTFHERRDA